jgi:hypothetical protein
MGYSIGISLPNLAKIKMPRVLFARIGSMKYYAGPQAGDERPRGGGAYTKSNVGGEVFNFAKFSDHLYGFVQASGGQIKLERIDPKSGTANVLDDVLVIFVAGQCIVGWYDGALVHRFPAALPATISKKMRKRIDLSGEKKLRIEHFRFEAPVAKAVLIPTRDRVFQVPAHVKGGFGQSNVCYLYETKGKPRISSWMKDAVSYVRNYEKSNLLKDPTSENETDEDTTIAEEQAAGFQSNPIIRRAVERYAMKRARSELSAKGYKNIQNTAKFKPYDYTCEMKQKLFFVEVKGTQTTGKSIILTKGEVNHVTKNPDSCVLILVHSVRVSGTKHVRVRAGTLELREAWRLRLEDLDPIQYMWTPTSV